MLKSNHRRLTLVQKLIASFALIGIFLITAVVYAIMGLSSMHQTVGEIARNDIAAATAVVTLMDTMHDQQRAVVKYQIFKQPEFKDVFYQHSLAFKQTLATLKKLSNEPDVTELFSAYRSYYTLADSIFQGTSVSDTTLKRTAERVDVCIDNVQRSQSKQLEFKLAAAAKRHSTTTLWALGLAMGGATMALLVAALLVYSFSASMNKLQRATHRIAAGEFDHNPQIAAGDEIGTLAQDFIKMAERLKELEQISLDASPLTRLPGNIAIERSLNRHLREGVSFAMCYLDLDNFKSYNDHYGYIKASEILKRTGELIYEAVKIQNDPDAFVGHIGGDDFVVIIDDKLVAKTSQEIITRFDAMIPPWYSEEDRAAGAIEGVDRYGVARTFPLISLSIAAMICQPGSYGSAAEIATAAAEVKDHIKKSSGSNYIIVQGNHINEA